MAEGMKGIVLVYAKILAGNKYSSRCSKRNVALAIANRSGSNSCCRIVTCSCDYFHILGETKLFRNLWLQGSHNLPALVNLRKLLFLHAADLQHFLRPAAVLHIKKQHTGCIRNICAEGSA